jgi:hypothetical protein
MTSRGYAPDESHIIQLTAAQSHNHTIILNSTRQSSQNKLNLGVYYSWIFIV